jgi:hypothetical protein
VDNILNPTYLDNELGHFGAVQEILRTTAPWASAWVGEAGGAYNSGHHLGTVAFCFQLLVSTCNILDSRISDSEEGRIDFAVKG